MRVLVDTSAWVEFLNGHASRERDAIVRLLKGEDDVCTCGVVVAELLQGLRRSRGRSKIEELSRTTSFPAKAGGSRSPC